MAASARTSSPRITACNFVRRGWSCASRAYGRSTFESPMTVAHFRSERWVGSCDQRHRSEQRHHRISRHSSSSRAISIRKPSPFSRVRCHTPSIPYPKTVGTGGFSPVSPDTYEKAEQGPDECPCPSEGSSVRSSSAVQSNR